MAAPKTRPPEQVTDFVAAVAQLPDWMAEHWLSILIASAIGVAIYLLLALLRAQVVRFCRTRQFRNHWATILAAAAQRTGHIFMALVAARLVAGYANPPVQVLTTVKFLYTISAVFQVAIWARAAVLGYVDLRTQGEGSSETLANASNLIRVLVTAALFLIALVVVLDNLGVNVTGLVAGLGIGGIAIGLAAQGIFSDLFASLSIIFDQPFRVGDTIDFGKGPATVERIGLKSTRMRALTGERFIVSNAQLLNKELVSFAGLDHRRFTLPLGLVYQTPPTEAAKVPDIAREVVESGGAIFVRAGFTAFGPAALEFEVQFDVREEDAGGINAIRHQIGIRLLERLNEQGFKFAYAAQPATPSVPSTQ